MTGQDLVFTVASAAAVASTILTVSRRNPIHAAAWMMVSLFSVAVIFLVLNLSFLFAIQILLYAGAILVLFVFVIMLLNPGPLELENDRPPPWIQWAAMAFALLLFVGLARAIASSEAATEPAFTAADARPLDPPDFGSTEALGLVLYDRYLVPFEMASVLIMAAIAAVIMLAKKRLEPLDRAIPEPDAATLHAPGGGNGHGHEAPAAAGHGAGRSH